MGLVFNPDFIPGSPRCLEVQMLVDMLDVGGTPVSWPAGALQRLLTTDGASEGVNGGRAAAQLMARVMPIA